MADFKFHRWVKGWIHRNQHLIGLDGFSDINNFIIYNNGIEKTRGFKRISLIPTDTPIDNVNVVIDDVIDIIDSFI